MVLNCDSSTGKVKLKSKFQTIAHSFNTAVFVTSLKQPTMTTAEERVIDVIIYHGREPKCSDGLAAAAVLSMASTHQPVVMLGYNHNDEVDLELCREQHVVMVDCVLPRAQLLQLAELSASLVVLDHHQSAERDLIGLHHPKLHVVLDLTRCGAQMAWDWCYPHRSQARPWPIEMVADRDLFKWALPWSKAVDKATMTLGFHDSVERFRALLVDYGRPEGFEQFVLQGQHYFEVAARQVQEKLRDVVQAHIDLGDKRYRVGLVSASFDISSELGQAICQQHPHLDFAVLWEYDWVTDEYPLRFRSSRRRVDVNLSVLSRYFPGGGGHPQAAGARLYGPRARPPPTLPPDVRGKDMAWYFTVIRD